MNAKVMAALAALKGINGQKAGTGKKYAHAYPYYAKLYNKAERTIVRWANEGRPLDDPKLMAEFMSNRGRKGPAIAEPPPEDLPPGDFDESSPIKLDEDFFKSAGVLAAVERLEAAEQERAAAYFQAVKKRQPAQIVQNRFKEWTSIVEALRKLALDVPAIRKANDLTVDRSEMDAGVAAVFAAFRKAARNLPGRAAAKLLAARTREEFVEILEGEIEVLLRSLTSLAAAAVQEAETPPPPPAPPVKSEPAPKTEPAKKKRRAKGGKSKC